MKKCIFAVAALLAVAMMFTACGKQDEAKDEPVSQGQNVDDKAEADTPEAEQETEKEANTEENSAEADKQEPKEESKETEAETEPAAPITNEAGEPVTSEDFEKLVDTFNNSDDEESKEEARKQLEAILKQAEANAQ